MGTYYAGFVPSDGKVAVLFPDLPGCLPWGDSMEQAFTSAVGALAAHLEAMADDGDPIPPPSGLEEARAKLREEYAALDLGPLPEDTMLMLVPAPNLDMRPCQVSLSLRRHALDMIDRKAAAAGMTRSGFLVQAAEAWQPG